MNRLTREEKFMRAAIKIAQKGLAEGEVPIGAVVVYEDKVVAKGYNRRAKLQLASAHAEMMAIDKACKKFSSWRLPVGCELYVTLEPCPMCAGAIRAAQIDELYFGAYNLNEGAAGTVYNILCPYVKVFGGIKKSDCEPLLENFFKNLRSNK